MKARSLTLLPAVALAAAMVPALAQTDPAPPSPEQAKLLQQQVNAWVTEMTAGLLPIPNGFVTFAPDGAGYRITAALGSIAQVEPKDAVITAQAHMLDATRWQIDSEQLPPSLKFAVQQLVPDAADPPPGQPRGKHLATLNYEMKFGAQTVTGVFDPTFTTPGNTQGTLASIDVVQTGGPAATISHIGPITSVSSTTPSGGGRVDTLIDATVENYETKAAIPGGDTSLTVTIDKIHLVSALTGLAHDKIAPLMGLLAAAKKTADADAAATTPGPAPKPVPPRPGAPRAPAAKPAPAPAATAHTRASLRSILAAANGLLTGAKLEEVLDGIVFDVDGHDGSLRHVAISFAGDAPQDTLTASMGLTFDGLTLTELPPALAAYVPSHFDIHPIVSNISLAALTKLGMDGSGPGGGPAPTDYVALFADGGINLGFDRLGLDIGDTKLAGTGSFNMTGPQTVTGQAEITAHGLDALITKAQADPMLVQAVPVLIFLKGIAKTNADESVWQISVAGGKALVNGVDMMAMMGGMSR